MRPRALVVVAALVALAGATVAILLHQGTRRSGTDRTPNGAFVIALQPGQTACQGLELLPADTAALQVTIGTYGHPGPPLSLLARGPAGRQLTTGALQAGWREGILAIPVRHVGTATNDAEVCLKYDRARGYPITIAGDAPDPGYSMVVGGKATPDTRIRIDYLRPGPESWAQMLPTIVHRFTLGKSGLIRNWAWVAVPLLMLLAIAMAIRIVLGDDPGPGEVKA